MKTMQGTVAACSIVVVAHVLKAITQYR